MKVIVQGRKEIRYYEIREDLWNNKEPYLTKDWENTKEEFITIKEMEADNNHILLNTYNYDDILITDYKGEKVDGEFRIIYDLEEDIVYLKSDVCIELVEPNKEEMKEELDIKSRVWNKETIEKDERLNSYCELHNLDKETVDINQVKRLIPSYATGGIVSNESIDELCKRMNRIYNDIKFV